MCCAGDFSAFRFLRVSNDNRLCSPCPGSVDSGHCFSIDLHDPQQHASFSATSKRQPAQLGDRRHDAADLGKPSQAADGRVAGMARLADIVEQLVAMIRPERDAPVRRRRRRAAASAPRSRVATTATMSTSPPRWSASMNEPSGSFATLRRWANWILPREALGDGRHVVGGTGAERARAQGDAVRGELDRAEDEGEVVCVATRCAAGPERARRIVGMDAHADADLLRGRDHLAQEAGEVVAQSRRASCRCSAPASGAGRGCRSGRRRRAGRP